MNFQVDVIIVGDSKNGHEMLDKLASSKSKTKFAFVSQVFKSTTSHDYANVKYFRNEVLYVGYRYRLFCCYLNNGDHIYGTHLIIASGLNYEPLMIDDEPVPCVYNNSDDIINNAKNLPALVVGKQKSDIQLAIDLAKKYKQVYLCAEDLSLINSSSVSNKLAKVENIAVLPNALIRKAISENGVLQKVELDNYSTISCSAIYLKTAAKPSVEFIPKKIVQKDDLGYLITSDKAESTVAPKCFAIGTCAKKYTKAMEKALIEAVLNDF
jgi:thioredoxin reductase